MATPDITTERGIGDPEQDQFGPPVPFEGQVEPDLNEVEVQARDQAEVHLLQTLVETTQAVLMQDQEHVEKYAHACLYLAQAYSALCEHDVANYQAQVQAFSTLNQPQGDAGTGPVKA